VKTKLIKTPAIPEKGTMALLFKDNETLPFTLSIEEEALWKKKPEKSDSLLIQRLPHFLFLVNADHSKVHHLVLEAYRKAGAIWMEAIKNEKFQN
jgi:hypothetical protein